MGQRHEASWPEGVKTKCNTPSLLRNRRGTTPPMFRICPVALRLELPGKRRSARSAKRSGFTSRACANMVSRCRNRIPRQSLSTWPLPPGDGSGLRHRGVRRCQPSPWCTYPARIADRTAGGASTGSPQSDSAGRGGRYPRFRGDGPAAGVRCRDGEDAAWHGRRSAGRWPQDPGDLSCSAQSAGGPRPAVPIPGVSGSPLRRPSRKALADGGATALENLVLLPAA